MFNWLRALAAFVSVSVLAGLLLATSGLQVVGPPALVSKSASGYWDSLPADLLEPDLPQRSIVQAADGTPIAELFLYNREVVPLEAVAPIMREALLAVEDTRFYDHGGVDLRGMARAARSTAGGDTQGASTLTQQYVKNVLVLAAETSQDPEAAAAATEQTLTRKLAEARYATALERRYSKDEILGKYLNMSYFGAGAYGVEAAAKRYFSVPASALTLPQAALLTGLLKNPAGYDPTKHPERALERRNVVLGRMLATGTIDQGEHDTAAASDLGLAPSVPERGCAISVAPFYCEYVQRVLLSDPAFGDTEAARKARLLTGGMVIRTALDLRVQQVVDAATANVVPTTHRVATASAVVEPGTGKVLALGTNRRYGQDEAAGQTEVLLPTVPAFQPGSTFKPFTLAAALEAGLPLSTRLPGGATHTSSVFDNPAKGYYSNSSEGGAANVDLTTATQLSMNTAYVQLQEKVGTAAVAEMAQRLGVDSLPVQEIKAREGSLTLGAREVSVLEMTNAYATLAARGKRCDPTVIVAVADRQGQALPTPDPQCRQVLSPSVADTVAGVLATVVEQGTGKSAAIGRPVAGKTGTTQEMGAAWFAGFTPQAASAVWVGDPKGPSNRLVNVLGHDSVYGGTVPADVWRRVMTGTMAPLPVVPLPTGDAAFTTVPAGAHLPQLAGSDAAQAAQRLKALGMGVRTQQVPRPEGGATGRVVSTEPAAGAPVRPGSEVVLRISN